MADDSLHRFQDARWVIDKMCDAQFGTTGRLLAALPTEDQVVAVDAGRGTKVVTVQPVLGEVLNPGPAFGHDPYPALENLYQARQSLDRAGHCGCAHGFFKFPSRKVSGWFGR